MEAIRDCIELNNGVKMPRLGYGTFRTPPGEDCYRAVTEAIEVGYRHIDTAAFYQNERDVGRAVNDSGLRREIFVTTKLWNEVRGHRETVEAFEQSMERLNLDVLDLFLIHWPEPKPFKDCYVQKNRESWAAMTDLNRKGRIRAIGVSNFLPKHLDELTAEGGIIPAANQIELHPQLKQFETVAYCNAHGIAVEAWRPILAGKGGEIDCLIRLAKQYGKSPSQICIRYLLQRGCCPLPKTTHKARMLENADVFDFALTDEDIAQIDALPEVRQGAHPSEAKF